MSKKSLNKRAILFADIVGSSRLYIEKGNTEAERLISSALSSMSNIVRRHDGIVVKTIGDEIMTCFADPTAACHAAISMNELLDKDKTNIRVGVAYGEVILKRDVEGNSDVFGDTVNNAAFMAKLAQARQIIISDGTLQACDSSISILCEKFDNVPIKGKKDAENVHRILWEPKSEESLDVTIMVANNGLNQTNTKTRLYLCTPDQTIIVNKTDEPIICGRDPATADISINSDKASRKHCSFYFFRGKFVIEDHSTNGTYMHPNNTPDSSVYIRRETIPLALGGTISFGQPNVDTGPQIRFEIHLNALD